MHRRWFCKGKKIPADLTCLFEPAWLVPDKTGGLLVPWCSQMLPAPVILLYGAFVMRDGPAQVVADIGQVVEQFAGRIVFVALLDLSEVAGDSLGGPQAIKDFA
jgi:hypothetical protein